MKKILCLSLLFCILACTLCIPVYATEPPSTVGVGAAVLINTETGTVIHEHNADTETSPAATARLMALLVSYERLSERMSERVAITNEMVRPYTSYNSFYIKSWRNLSDYVGQKVSVEDLFEHALVYSADDACYALAILAFGDAQTCIAAMNEKAKSLSMTHTEYTAIVSGGSGAKTTARDVSRLASEFSRNTLLLDIASSTSKNITVGGDSVTVYSRNLFNSTYYGKGYYDSEINGLLSAQSQGVLLSMKRKENLSYLCVVMNADTSGASKYPDGREANAYTVSRELLDFGVENYGYCKVLSELRVFADIPVTLSKQADFVAAVPSGELLAFLPTSTDVETEINYDVHIDYASIEAPVRLGDTVGYVDVIYKGESLGRVALITNAAISKSLTLEVTDFARRVISYPLTIVILCASALVGVGYVLYRAQKIGEEKGEE